MKIGIIKLNLVSEDGDSRMVYSKARSLINLGHTVTIFTVNFNPDALPEFHKGIPVEVIPFAKKSKFLKTSSSVFGKIFYRVKYLYFSRRALAVLKVYLSDKKLDIVDLHNDYSYQLAKWYKKFHRDTFVIWTMNNCPFYRSKKSNLIAAFFSIVVSFFERSLVKIYIGYIDSIIANDEEQRDVISKLSARVHMFRIPVNFELFYAPLRSIEQNTKKCTLLSIGSLSPARNFEDTIAAGAKLRDLGYDVTVEIICNDYWRSKEYRKKLVDLVEESHMRDYVNFYFEGVDERELLGIQRKSTFFVFPNKLRIWGMAAFEAMAAGLPLIVSSTTSVAEELEDGKNTVIVGAGDTEAMAMRMSELLKDPKKYRDIASAGQSFSRENLSWEKYAEKYVGLA